MISPRALGVATLVIFIPGRALAFLLERVIKHKES